MAIEDRGALLYCDATEPGDTLVSEHFTVYELRCRHCKVMQVTKTALARLEAFRSAIKQPVRLSSAYRCFEHNKAIDGARSSRHVTAEAFDAKIVNSFQAYVYVAAAMEVGFLGIGVHEDFIHMDERLEPRLWPY